MPATLPDEADIIPAPRSTEGETLSEDEILAEIDAELRRQDRPPIPSGASREPSPKPRPEPAATLSANWADLAGESLKRSEASEAQSLEDVILDYLAGD